uniref:Uncharacterized protein n=1 Tax=Arundo donax TaxID=35708 RepID=A0A0A9I5K3_ARUDO
MWHCFFFTLMLVRNIAGSICLQF